MNANLFDIEFPAPLNALSDPERMALVASVKRTCAKEARAAAAANPAHEFEDLEQEAMLASVHASRRWSPTMGTKFNTYATSCVRRHLANVTTSCRGEGLTHIDGWDAIPARPGEPTEPDEVPPMSEELAALIAQMEADERERQPITEAHQEAIRRLNPDARAVVTLLVVYGFSVERVAEQLGRPVKDVKLIARNAAKALPREIARAKAPNLFTEVA